MSGLSGAESRDVILPPNMKCAPANKRTRVMTDLATRVRLTVRGIRRAKGRRKERFVQRRGWILETAVLSALAMRCDLAQEGDVRVESGTQTRRDRVTSRLALPTAKNIVVAAPRLCELRYR